MHYRLIAVAAAAWRAAAVKDPTDHVITTIGSDNRFEISYGNTLPIVGAPWGHTYWVPEVTHMDDIDNWWFNMRSPRLVGIRCSHQPSPWIRDWGFFKVLFGYSFQSTPLHDNGYDPRKATWEPWIWETDLMGVEQRSGRAHVTITADHAASHLRLTFPPFDDFNKMNQTRRLSFQRPPQKHFNNVTDWTVTCTGGRTTVEGKTDAHSAGVSDPTRFYLRFSVDVDAECWGYQLFTDDKKPDEDIMTIDYKDTIDELNVRIGVSVIDHAQAARNRAHLADKSFSDSVTVNREAWRKVLSVINVTDTGFGADEEEDQLKMFYSFLYRSALFPRNLGEMDVDGKEVHRSPNIKKCTGNECDDEKYDIFSGPLSSDSGFWDAYHTIYDMLQLLWPEQAEIALRGYLNAYKEGEWVPQWSSPGYRSSMDGTMSDLSFADSMLKGFLTGEDEDGAKWSTLALQAMKKHAFSYPEDEGSQVGRRGLAVFRDRGYISTGTEDNFGAVRSEVSQTLLHSFADYGVLKALEGFDKETPPVFTEAEKAELEKSQFYWKNVFDKEVKFMRPRKNGTDPNTPEWDDEGEFDQFLWGPHYTEGGPHQYRFTAPHDVEGMIDAYGDIPTLCDTVIATNTAPKLYHRYFGGSTGYITAGMNDFALLTWGQNGHCNQPSHHFQYMPIAAMELAQEADLATLYDKCVAPTQHWLRHTLKNCYSLTNYCGDEDNGELSAWYILTALGFYDMAPGSLKYRLGIPLFKEVVVKSDTLDLTIKGDGNCPTCEKVTSVKLDNTAVPRFFVTWDQLTGAEELEFDFDT